MPLVGQGLSLAAADSDTRPTAAADSVQNRSSSSLLLFYHSCCSCGSMIAEDVVTVTLGASTAYVEALQRVPEMRLKLLNEHSILCKLLLGSGGSP
jgi:hypothetical protein